MRNTYIAMSLLAVVVIVAVAYVFVQVHKVAPAPVATAQAAYDDAGYTDPNYNKTSDNPLSAGEQTVSYTYPGNACGTLMTDSAAVGSVSPGTGPVFALASQSCAKKNASSYPDEYSFRAYSCQNETSTSTGQIVGMATFAFTCKTQ